MALTTLPHRFACLLPVIGCVSACGAAAPSQEYASTLEAEAAALTLHAADTRPGVLEVWITSDTADGDHCPLFDLTGSVNGAPLVLVEPGGIAPPRPEQPGDGSRCFLPTFELQYEPGQPGPDSVELLLQDRSAKTLRAVVQLPAGAPSVTLLQESVEPGGDLQLELSPIPESLDALARLSDAAGQVRPLNVRSRNEGQLTLIVPSTVQTGAGTLTLAITDWLPSETTLCEGPRQCSIRLRESLGNYDARSQVSQAVVVR